ncbi:YkgJ family cysteine cluster protein [Endozoicomonas sp. SM1973]|uniref:YkgJ family cysteine cluster protein n=1 Tax=Spartinivicinus marinus TaxID=2994442 RepID=A0A853IAX4_9GAMM|nr:YkgJ family cysteine cluster protein [Spartinivicinus marinus]MCX4030145.1 YkgJ family cysteine cluster protein [Spartinivicinus marinus]NYZ67788.1 YkgJ family cysteine cluster protein [Spartinivicinus marinus]
MARLGISQEKIQKKGAEFHKSYLAFQKDLSKYKKVSNAQLIPITDQLEVYRSNLDCKPGCSYCCHYRVTAFTHEIVAIYLHIHNTFTPKQLNRIKEKIIKTASTVSCMSEEERISTNVECPMLIDDRCSTYSVRPMSCAGFHSTSLEFCKRQFQGSDEINGASAWIMKIGESLLIERSIADNVIRHTKQDHSQYELVTSLATLLKKPSLIAKWRKTGKPIFSNATV